MIELNEKTRWILGRPNFWCAPVAEQLRHHGFEIDRKAEAQQASVIHWLLSLYEKHGDDYIDHAQAFLKSTHEPNPAGA